VPARRSAGRVSHCNRRGRGSIENLCHKAKEASQFSALASEWKKSLRFGRRSDRELDISVKVIFSRNGERPVEWIMQPTTLFLCGDVMTGRGIDQALPHPGDPTLYESFIRDARDYVRLAETAYGAIPRPLGFSDIWGDALDEFERVVPDVRIINLETSVTRSDAAWPHKGVHYRMNPANVRCLTAAKIDCCTLANNHVLDWGRDGLLETLDVLHAAGLHTAGAGRNLHEAQAPAVLHVPAKGRVFVFACGSQTSGIPADWTARPDRSGVNVVAEWSDQAVEQLREQVHTDCIVVVSIHWGPNWGYGIPHMQRQFAHRLIDEADVDVVCGHSSHHVKGIEVYRDRLILYGCGDLLTDYEGIRGYDDYRGDLGLMYFARLEPSGRLAQLTMTPTCMRHFRVNRAEPADALWLNDLLNREGKDLATRTELDADGRLVLFWE
jgi:poly-gamma-glutamate capsule biosynthesis protein CapA/YwtB (metallophosphatase superfamily)